MANKSAADLKKEGVELKALFAKVKKKPHNCAILMSKDGIVIEAHLKKSPEIMLKAAKKAGGMPKGAWGVMTIEGQIITVDPVNDKVPGSLTKIAKKFFSERGLKNRLEIKEPEEAAAEEAAPAQEASANKNAGDPAAGGEEADQRSALLKRMTAARKKVDAVLADTGYDMHSEMVNAVKAYAAAMKAADFDKATSAFEDVDYYLTAYAAYKEKKDPLTARLKAASKGITAILNGDDSDAAREMKDAIGGFKYNIGNDEWISAASKLDWIEEQISALKAAEAAASAPEARQSGGPAGGESASGSGVTQPDEGGSSSGSGAAAPSAPTEPAAAAPPAGLEEAYAAAKKKLAQYSRLKKANVAELKTDLATVKSLMKAKDPEKDREAMDLLSGMEPKFLVVSTAYCDLKKKEAKADIDIVKTYFGMALEVPKLEASYAKLETECLKNPVNFKVVRSIVQGISTKEIQLKKRSQEYKAEYEKLAKNIDGWCDAWLPDISDPAVQTEYNKIVIEISVAKKKLEENSPALAKKLALKIHFKIKDLIKMLAERSVYLVLKSTVQIEHAGIDAVRNEGVEVALKAIEADMKKANGFEDKRMFYDATLLMEPIPALIPPLMIKAMEFTAYRNAARVVIQGIATIQKNPQFEFVKPEYAELMAKYKAAGVVANKEAYKEATDQLTDMVKTVASIILKAEKASAYKDFENELENGDVDDLRKQAVALLADLKAHPRAKLAMHLLAEVEEHVKNLDSTWNQWIDSSARKELVIISGLANQARAKLDRVDAFVNRADRLAVNVGTLSSSHPQGAYIRPFISKIAKLVQKAKLEAIAGKTGVAKELATGETWLVTAEETADKEVKHRARELEIEALIAAISGDGVTFEGKEKTLADIAKLMISADEASKTFKHDIAQTAFSKVETLCMTAKIGASAQSGTPPSKDEIKKLLALPGGQDSLDALIKSLPASTQQDVMINVLEARFGMEVHVYKTLTEGAKDDEKSGAALNVPAPNLMAYYDMLKSLPASHTTLNPSLARFDQVEKDDASWFEPGNDTVVMTVDNAMDHKANPIGDPDELDDIDADSVSPSIAEEPTYGSWTTFHEIGHAVDDHEKFMDRNGSGDDFGGWAEYGTNIGPIAYAAADEFEFDSNYIERIMAGGSPKPPEIPADLKEKEGANAKEIWEKRQKKFEDWLKNVSVGAKPWASASKVNKHQIGGIMYHEAYANSWVSYKAAARKKGLTGYQFRAPGEWFSELYAAYHTKKLSSSHPANSWLDKLSSE